MNYFYFFFFLFLSIIILYKPLAKIISNWVLGSENLIKTGVLTALIGVLCIYFGTKNPIWNERMWMVVTLILGIVLLIRGLVIIFFLKGVKKQIPLLIKHYYKFSIPVSIIMACIAFVVVSNDYIGPQKDISSCESDNNVNLICGFNNPEDIVITPDKEFLLMSEFGGIGPYEEQKPGFFALLELSSGTRIVPNVSIGDSLWGDPSCTRNNYEFGPHGIDLIERSDGKFQLGVISHFPNETIEMFEIQKNKESWDMIWRGCVDVPYEYYFNDISLKNDGGFLATHMYSRDITLNKWLLTSLLKSDSGYLVEWNDNKFFKIEGTEGSGPNGIALDRDSNILYINYNQGDLITKFDLSTNKKIHSQFIEAPDNPYIDGNYVWVTSLDFQPNDFGECEFKKSCSLPFSIYKLNKDTLEILDKHSFSKTVFGLPTVAVPVDENLYMGSFHSDRLGYFKIN
tara:strand:+ start:1018 stop:2385 length:1368 start_codon:yes stop_codon:yes gene_type:complete